MPGDSWYKPPSVTDTMPAEEVLVPGPLPSVAYNIRRSAISCTDFCTKLMKLNICFQKTNSLKNRYTKTTPQEAALILQGLT